jgi:hypothetical protein
MDFPYLLLGGALRHMKIINQNDYYIKCVFMKRALYLVYIKKSLARHLFLCCNIKKGGTIMATANLEAATGERIQFKFDNFQANEHRPPEIVANNYNPVGVQYGDFWVSSYVFTSVIDVSIALPQGKPIPQRIIVKLENVNNNNEYPLKEYREFVVRAHTEAGVFATKTWNIVLLCVASGRPRLQTNSRQTVEFILEYADYSETLICPLSGTSKFSMCLAEIDKPQYGVIAD